MNNPIINSIFSVPIFEDNLDVNFKELSNWCLTTSDSSSPIYCGHHDRTRSSIHNATSELSILSKKIIDSAVTSYYKMQNPNGDFTNFTPPPIFFMKRMWCNIYNRNGYMDPHNHYESPYVGTFYLTDSPAKISFYHPSQYRPNDRYKVIPTPGKLIIWPGWLAHQVEPNFSDDIRISISFKLEFIIPNIDNDGRRMDTEMGVNL